MDEMADNSEPVNVLSLVQSTAELSDPELVARVRAGDEEAFEELFNRHRRRVALIAGRFFRQQEQIEEIVQESFTKAYFALGDFTNAQEASFVAWLARIAFNTCYDELRRLKRRPESALSNISEEEDAWLREQLRDIRAEGDVESALVARDLADKLLSRLSPEDRLLLVMLDAEGMSVSEIAESTKWSISKVKVRAHRARVRLRGVLKRFL
ncbi:MAG TPA: sigma-70 family RNA polymerase sigma factor [Pyrinomonadaceae bacterium]|jgi:RNA polymerase sigma-70 factor (ECF subfamily)